MVLHNGSPVEMPWIDKVAAVLECYLGGQAVGAAQVDVLFGKVNPSGKLAETFPVQLEDNPSFLNFPGEGDTVCYREGIFVGYRYYDTKKMDVLFPFGHGLSYTTFAYGNLTVDRDNIKDTDTVTVTVDVTNTGSCAGKEVVQLYVAGPHKNVIRPEKELKGFEKVSLEPGETKTVTFTLEKRAFAYWNTVLADWHVETGVYGVKVGASSRDIRLERKISVTSTQAVPHTYTIHSTMGDVMENPKLAPILADTMAKISETLGGQKKEEGEAASAAISEEMSAAMMRDMPLRSAMSFTGGKVSYEDLVKMVEQMNSVE